MAEAVGLPKSIVPGLSAIVTRYRKHTAASHYQTENVVWTDPAGEDADIVGTLNVHKFTD